MSLEPSETAYLESLISGIFDPHSVGMAQGVLFVYMRQGKFDECGAKFAAYCQQIYRASIRITVRQFSDSMDKPETCFDGGIPAGFDEAVRELVFDETEERVYF